MLTLIKYLAILGQIQELLAALKAGLPAEGVVRGIRAGGRVWRLEYKIRGDA